MKPKQTVYIDYELSDTPIKESVKVFITKNKKTRELKQNEFTINENLLKIK